MNINKFLSFLCIVLLFAGISAGCRTTKNTGVAIKEGTEEAAQKTGQKMEDGSITAAIKMKMANNELVKASNIDVDTNHGKVTLNGTVGSEAEKDRAIQLAQSVDGVKSVSSNLTVNR